MTTFTLIDNNSGFVWGTTTADNITEAARMLDESLGEFGRVYGAGTLSDMRTTGTAYAVYEDTTSQQFTAENYEAVTALPLAGYVTVTIPNEA